MQFVLGAAAFVAAAVPAIGFAAQSHREAMPWPYLHQQMLGTRGAALFDEAISIKERLGFMSKVKAELHELFEFLREFEEDTGTKLIIVAFVDDLDRCLGGRNVREAPGGSNGK